MGYDLECAERACSHVRPKWKRNQDQCVNEVAVYRVALLLVMIDTCCYGNHGNETLGCSGWRGQGGGPDGGNGFTRAWSDELLITGRIKRCYAHQPSNLSLTITEHSCINILNILWNMCVNISFKFLLIKRWQIEWLWRWVLNTSACTHTHTGRIKPRYAHQSSNLSLTITELYKHIEHSLKMCQYFIWVSAD